METIHKFRKANKRERSLLARVNETIALQKQVMKSSHAGRQGNRIAFNCRVYHFLELKDLDRVIAALRLLDQDAVRVRQEFTKTRIENVYHHVLQDNASYFFDDWLAGAAFNSLVYVKKMMEECLQSWPKYKTDYIDLADILKRKRTAGGACRAIKKFFESDARGLQHLAFINRADVFQFGRCGGWMSIADFDSFSEISDRFSSILNKFFSADGQYIILPGVDTREQWWELLYSEYDFSFGAVTSEKARCEAVLWLLSQGRAMVTSINKEHLVDRLTEEVHAYLSGETIEATKEAVAEWMAGKGPLRTNSVSLSYLRLCLTNSSELETTLGVKIPVVDGLKLFNILVASIESEDLGAAAGLRIGRFTIDSLYKVDDDYILKAGCHRISWNHITKFVAEYLRH